MDDFKLPTITQEQYDCIAKLVKRAMFCSSAKEAEPYIQEICSLARDFPNRAYYKVCEISCGLREYCKRNSDKAKTGYYLNNLVGGLQIMIGETE